MKIMNLKIAMVIGFLAFMHLHAEPFLQVDIPWKDRFPYRATTQRFLGKISYNEIDSTLRNQSFVLTQREFFEQVTGQEERGHIGYHASGHRFRVFQDIIRIVFEEVLNLEFKKDFYFFRLPGDPNVFGYSSAYDFLSKNFPIDDNIPYQRDQLISTNFTPYNNYNQKYECTAVFFEKSLSFKPPDFMWNIIVLFDFLGMPDDKIPKLFQVGQMLEEYEAGTLFQFFDLSHQDPKNRNAFEFVDRYCYPCIKKGVPQAINKTFSDLLQGTLDTKFLNQYRIVVDHSCTLNPYGPLLIKRYDLIPHSVIKKYEEKLREIIRSIPYDKGSVKIYKARLAEYWNL